MARISTRAAEPRSKDEPESPEAEAEAERWAAWQRWERFVLLAAPVDLEAEPTADAGGQ